MYDFPLLLWNQGFKFQDSVCNGCHGLTMLSINISYIAIMTIRNVDYRCVIHNISKSEAINWLKSSVLEDRGYVALIFSLLKTVFFFLHFLL